MSTARIARDEYSIEGRIFVNLGAKGFAAALQGHADPEILCSASVCAKRLTI
jgi:hypothetical protein